MLSDIKESSLAFPRRRNLWLSMLSGMDLPWVWNQPKCRGKTWLEDSRKNSGHPTSMDNFFLGSAGLPQWQVRAEYYCHWRKVPLSVLIINSIASPAWHFRPSSLISILLHSFTALQCCFKTWGETCRKVFYSEEGWVLPVREISQGVCFLFPTAPEWWKECKQTSWSREIHADYQTLAQKRCDGHHPGSWCLSALFSPDLSWHGCKTLFYIRENLQYPAVAGTSEQCFSKSRVWSKACKAPW